MAATAGATLNKRRVELARGPRIRGVGPGTRPVLWMAMVVVLLLGSTPPAPAESAGAVLLVATERVRSSVFARSVILATRHGAGGGAIGLILNQPTSHRLSELTPGGDDGAASPRVFLGGPVDTSRLVFLVRAEQGFERALQVLPGVFMSENVEVLSRMLDTHESAGALRVFRGFSGWAPGQLEAEIRRGDWRVRPVDTALLFTDPATLWERLTSPGDDGRVVAVPGRGTNPG